MKKYLQKGISLFTFLVLIAVAILMVKCSNHPAEETKGMSESEYVKRGDYLVNTMGCADCHSPKTFSEKGPEPDNSRFLAGHPEGSPLPPIDTNALHPGYWVMASPDLTMWVAPFGVSYTANLTPDSTTGIGAWTEDNFIKALRTGKHLGMDGGRPILPPMPWTMYAKLTDDDLKAIYQYLRSIPAIKNKVPSPLSPPEVRALVSEKKS